MRIVVAAGHSIFRDGSLQTAGAQAGLRGKQDFEGVARAQYEPDTANGKKSRLHNIFDKRGIFGRWELVLYALRINGRGWCFRVPDRPEWVFYAILVVLIVLKYGSWPGIESAHPPPSASRKRQELAKSGNAPSAVAFDLVLLELYN
jgi:hypothetical protein